MKKRILIVEDDVTIQTQLKTLLTGNGYEAAVVTDFSTTIEQVKALNPHLVLLDIRLPGNSGFEICSQIRAFSDMPIVFVTSSTTDMDELNSIMLGGDAFLSKPYNPAILLAKIAALLRRAYASGQTEVFTWNGAALHLESSQKIVFYYDIRLAFPVQVMYWGNVLLPLLILLWPVWWLLRRKKTVTIPSTELLQNTDFPAMLLGLLALSVPNILLSASVPAMINHYYLSLGAGMMNQYLFFVLINLIFFLCSLIYLAGSLLAAWKEKSPEHRYHRENLFFFGQILSKLNTTSKTMSLISVTLVLAIFMFIAAPILVGWASGYLDVRSVYDVQIFSRYNDVYEEENLPLDDYGIVTDFLAEHGIQTDHDCTFSLYLPGREDFGSVK